MNLVELIDAVLPQTQCTKCGYQGCRPYAQAIVQGEADINRCPPGGDAGVAKLATLLKTGPLPLDETRGPHLPLQLAVIDERHCIGCTLCIQACPVDAILGANKHMHTVLPELCTGCDLCVAPCPVDCITMIDVAPTRPWSALDAAQARQRYHQRNDRLRREERENNERLQTKALDKLQQLPQDDGAAERKRAVLDAALARARARRTTDTSNNSG